MARKVGACVLSLSSGRPPFLSQQLLQELEEEKRHDSSGDGDASTNASPAALSFAADVGTLLPGKEALKEHSAAHVESDMRSFFGLSASLFVVAQIRSGLLAPPDTSVAKGAGDVVLLSSAMERIAMPLEEYLDLASNVMHADLTECPYEAVGPGYSRKHADRALKRARQWTEKALSWWNQEDNGARSGQQLLLPVVGLDENAQQRCLEDVRKLAKEAGIASLGGAESSVGISLANLRYLDADTQITRIRKARAQAGPDVMLYAVMGTASLPQLVAALAVGANAVETSLPYMLTKLNTALSFAVEAEGPGGPLTVNLLDTRLCEDKAPISAGCPCWACERHTRGYMQHLLSAKELLGQMLLYLHNASMLIRLLEHVRALPSEEDRLAFARAWAPGLSSSLQQSETPPQPQV
ncbi:Queuine tRNA-ribosyltransferase accessory subunit 2 [Hondaea fermentalgiana]|uniref:Queuine tRNA-ribosyltransferase accessory subunit 2 n=1 Tax=Hondaea fermentalgiana TaxID=2315210 RepID=A0A2R5GTA3_9STRA|nr:Queuine tRNA-ribosyltransferase accessory subunit 2 [Hondaea fermentalgiana]|eukprot:GBG31114.1 Queuine tRNA-ribosyltransferase accessory subunit 2 [Hondaea fermentalgiana]